MTRNKQFITQVRILHQTVTDLEFTTIIYLQNPEVIETGAIKYGRGQIASLLPSRLSSSDHSCYQPSRRSSSSLLSLPLKCFQSPNGIATVSTDLLYSFLQLPLLLLLLRMLFDVFRAHSNTVPDPLILFALEMV